MCSKKLVIFQQHFAGKKRSIVSTGHTEYFMVRNVFGTAGRKQHKIAYFFQSLLLKNTLCAAVYVFVINGKFK